MPVKQQPHDRAMLQCRSEGNTFLKKEKKKQTTGGRARNAYFGNELVRVKQQLVLRGEPHPLQSNIGEEGGKNTRLKTTQGGWRARKEQGEHKQQQREGGASAPG